MAARQHRNGAAAQETKPEQRGCPVCTTPVSAGADACSQGGVPLRPESLQAVQKDATADRDVASPASVDLPRRQTLVLLVCDLSGCTGDAMEYLESSIQAVRMFGGWPAYASGTEVAFRFDSTSAPGMCQFAVADMLDRGFDAGLNVVLDLGRGCAGLRVALHEGDALFVKGSAVAATEAEFLGSMRDGMVLEGPVRRMVHAMCLAAPPIGMVISAAAANGLAPARRTLLQHLPAHHPAARVGGAYLWQPILAASE
ncbi:hypothetical protein [Paracraurococcus lichenis]|uniref:Uncharacterized protein n=1 Tax=Paracraurococcus lichenis TaxID=3064888 RepID=A0ABT9ED28_9PROT|nr:hypothetical protein [Paracraurococcus sp. LOR1-02]MDO9714014.1 hypothetical protein [Paracraurococcus sp. LOR1-02]